MTVAPRPASCGSLYKWTKTPCLRFTLKLLTGICRCAFVFVAHAGWRGRVMVSSDKEPNLAEELRGDSPVNIKGRVLYVWKGDAPWRAAQRPAAIGAPVGHRIKSHRDIGAATHG